MRQITAILFLGISLFGCGFGKPSQLMVNEAHRNFLQEHDKLEAFSITNMKLQNGYLVNSEEYVTNIEYIALAEKSLHEMKIATDHLGRRLHTPYQIMSIQSVFGDFKKGDEFEVISKVTLVKQIDPSTEWVMKDLNPESVTLIDLGL